MSKFSAQTAAGFYAEHVGKAFFPNLSNAMTSDVCLGLELVAKEAVTKWREVIGPTNTAVAKTQAPGSIRAHFGVDGTLNAAHGSDSMTSYQRESNFWFGGKPEERAMQTTAVLNNCTLCIIKPHAIKEGLAG